MRDVFRFKASDVGDIEKVVIRHDNTGVGPDWHLQQVNLGFEGSPCTAKSHAPRQDRFRGTKGLCGCGLGSRIQGLGPHAAAAPEHGHADICSLGFRVSGPGFRV